MSFELMRQVWRLELKGTEQHVLMAMADYANDEGGHCYPSVARLAWKTGCSESTIVRTIDRLVAKNVVIVVRPATNKAPPHYQICLENGEVKAPYCSDSDDSRDSILTPQEDSRDVKMLPQESQGYQNDTSGGVKMKPGGSILTPKPISNQSTNQPDNEIAPFSEKAQEKSAAETAQKWGECVKELAASHRTMGAWLQGSELLATGQMRDGKPLYRLLVVDERSVDWLKTQAERAILRNVGGIVGKTFALDISAEFVEAAP